FYGKVALRQDNRPYEEGAEVKDPLLAQDSSGTFESGAVVRRIKHQHNQIVFRHKAGVQRLADI
ncbi:hypothetical protein, partial [Salmonella enterica]|uniref:hypothetical protein n=1 Tax=Salmonella enterica TaxID=28901 RepID=UPI0021002322